MLDGLGPPGAATQPPRSLHRLIYSGSVLYCAFVCARLALNGG
jgi:hypothetical protein